MPSRYVPDLEFVRQLYIRNAITPVSSGHPDVILAERGAQFDRMISSLRSDQHAGLPVTADTFDPEQVRPRMGYFEGEVVYGWCIVAQGHGLTEEQVVAIVQRVNPASVPVATEEGSYNYKPNIVHCFKWGDPCMYNGERHGHWFPGAESDPRAHPYTIIRTT